MKTAILILCLIPSVLCIGQNSNIKQYLIEGSDSCIISNKDNSINIDYQKCIVQILNKNSANKQITITSKMDNDTLFQSNKHTDYFYGLLSGKLLLDNGTGNIRKLMVIDLTKNDTLSSLQYKGTLKIIDAKIIFYFPYLTEEPAIKPNCPDAEKWKTYGGGTGYIEERLYDISKNNVINTGNIKCQYFE